MLDALAAATARLASPADCSVEVAIGPLDGERRPRRATPRRRGPRAPSGRRRARRAGRRRRARPRRRGRADSSWRRTPPRRSRAARAMPASMAAWSSCAKAPYVWGPSKVRWYGVIRDDVHRDPAQLDRAARRGALTHAVPVVDDRHARRRADRPRRRASVRPRRGGRGPGSSRRRARRCCSPCLRRASSGPRPPRSQRGAVVAHVLGADLRLRVAEPLAAPAPRRRRTPAGRGSPVPQRVDVDEVAVRDLRDVGVARREQPEHLGDRHRRAGRPRRTPPAR